jgi:hypothetical protein
VHTLLVIFGDRSRLKRARSAVHGPDARQRGIQDLDGGCFALAQQSRQLECGEITQFHLCGFLFIEVPNKSFVWNLYSRLVCGISGTMI